MAISKRKRRGSWLMFGVRGLGVAGLFAALLGVIGARGTPDFHLTDELRHVWSNVGYINELLFHTSDRFLTVCLWLLTIGAIAAIVSIILLLLGGLGRMAGRRNVAGSNAALQTALCLALLIGANWYSFGHHQRFDWTGRRWTWQGVLPGLVKSERFDPQFTLPQTVIDDLKQLRGETTVVVYQRHKTFGQLSDKPDAYDYAAERKVVEKVKDLVQMFREFGPTFRVEVLDVEDEGYAVTLKKLTQDRPRLEKAIETAPENSIFFHTRLDVAGLDGKPEQREAVQRLSFNDLYQLDKSTSRTANNLVLLPQGVASFARRVLAVEEKKPRIAIGTIHEYLTTDGIEEFSLAGMKKSLEANGFEVVDLVLKNWGDGEPTPAARTLQESQLERLEEDLAEYDAVIAINRQSLKESTTILDKLKSKLTLEELNQELRQILRGQRFNEEMRKRSIASLEAQLDTLKELSTLQERERAEVLKQLDAIPGQERLAEQRRLSDVKSKFTRLLSDCDLLILPRMTLRNAVVGDRIPARIYPMDQAQAGAVKDFLASGKPVFALFGPNNEPAERRTPTPTPTDGIEPLFAQLGIVFGNQTVLFNSESKAFSQRRSSLLATGADVEIPPVLFERPAVKRGIETDDAPTVGPNTISRSLKIVAGAAGSTDKLDKLKLRHPRPVYFVPIRGASNQLAEFLYADAESWNESDPFPTRERTPRYEPTKPDNPLFGTRDAKTRGPFPIGIAVETTVPAEWLGDYQPSSTAGAALTAIATNGDPMQLATQALIPPDTYAVKKRTAPLRLAAVGHGGLFVGPELSPAKEQLLLLTCNWLMSRDERLPHNDRKWEYPRVNMSERRKRLWRDGALVALPGAFAFLGAMVLLVRKYR